MLVPLACFGALRIAPVETAFEKRDRLLPYKSLPGLDFPLSPRPGAWAEAASVTSVGFHVNDVHALRSLGPFTITSPERTRTHECSMPRAFALEHPPLNGFDAGPLPSRMSSFLFLLIGRILLLTFKPLR